MAAIASEPMAKISSHVHMTKNYSQFKSIGGNRNINQLHLKRLRDSMEQNYLFTIIIVNDKNEIIDGQHRFNVIKELGLPMYYITCAGYGLNEVHILNQNSKTWKAQDYMEGYCNLGYQDYIDYARFKEKYGFGHNECILLLGGDENGAASKIFYYGKFKIKNYKEAEDKAEKLHLIGKYYPGYNRRTFIRAMNQIFSHPNFNFSTFMHKLSLQPLALQDCSNGEQYALLIEEIYNYRSREKVSLRY